MVWSGEWEDADVDAVFSTEDRAQKWVREQLEEWPQPDISYCIKSMELDSAGKPTKRDREAYPYPESAIINWKNSCDETEEIWMAREIKEKSC